MNSTILVPTDFSNNSLVAARYAMELAKKLQASLHILHTYHPFTSAFQSRLANKTDEQRTKSEAEKGLAEFMGKLDNSSNVNMSSSIENNGILLDAIKKYIEEKNVCLVVMGTHGASGTRKDLLGSNTYDVAKDVPRPLLIVPEHSKSFKLDNVVFFSDYQQGDIKSVRSLDSLFGHLGLSCTLVHIHEGSNAPQDNDQQKLAAWKAVLEKETSLQSFSTELVHVPENVDGVNEIIKRLDADTALITLIDSRSFFKKLQHKSLARAIILNPQTPVLLTSEDTE